MILFSFMRHYFKKWQFDDNEFLLLKQDLYDNPSLNNKNEIDHQTFAFQICLDYYYLGLHALAIKEIKKDNPNNLIIGIVPKIPNLNHPHNYLLYPKIYSLINNYLLLKKWKKLYSKIGIDRFIHINNSALSGLSNLFRAFKIYKTISSKNDLLNLTINNIKCGDLIYDSYLRYRVQPTVNISSVYLLYYIYSSINLIHKSEQIFKKNPNLNTYFTSYTTYIHHGIIVRFFLKKKLKIYSSGNLQQSFKLLSEDDYYHTANFKNYKHSFNFLSDQEIRLSKARELLKSKFSGKIDSSLSYMRSSSFNLYNTQDNTVLTNIEGVIFLHDFYDSPHVYGNMLFPDFYDWTKHTLNLIKNHNLKIAIKPHPNQISENDSIINFLKEKYSSLLWIDPKTSNSILLNSNIKFGISVYGTVLHELAYHGKLAISAGDNPHSSFDFILKPDSIERYDDYILNFNEYLNINDAEIQKEVEKFYYMHNIANKSDFIINEVLIKNYSMVNSSSQIISDILPYLLKRT